MATGLATALSGDPTCSPCGELATRLPLCRLVYLICFALILILGMLPVIPKLWFSILYHFYASFVAMIATVWGAESVPLSPALPATSTTARVAGDSCTNPDSALSHLCHHLSLVSFDASDFNVASPVVYRLFTTF